MTKQTRKVKLASDRVVNLFKNNLDQFGQTVGFEINGAASLTSCTGAILSMLIIMIVLFFAASRFQVVYEFCDTTHQQTIEYGTVSHLLEQEYTQFNVAFNLVTMNFYSPPTVAPDMNRYVKIIAFIRTMPESGPQDFELGVHKCTADDKESQFKNLDNMQSTLYREIFDEGNLMCIDDPSQLALQGIPFETVNSRVLRIMILRCSGEVDDCATEKEIDDFIDS